MSDIDLKTSVSPYEKALKLTADTSSADWSDNSQFEINLAIIQCIKCCFCVASYEKEAVELKNLFDTIKL